MHADLSGGRGVYFEPILLGTFIRTIGIVVSASAPSALDLQQMTREYWDFLLSLRSALKDASVAEAILFGMLVILEITEPRHAAEYFPKQVVETQAWAAGFVPIVQPINCRLVSGNGRRKIKDVGWWRTIKDE